MWVTCGAYLCFSAFYVTVNVKKLHSFVYIFMAFFYALLLAMLSVYSCASWKHIKGQMQAYQRE